MHIAVVEDSDDDIVFIKRALDTHAPEAQVTIIQDTETALELLVGDEGLGEAGDPPLRPSFVLLDLNLGSGNGYQVLEALRSRPSTMATVVIVLTTSQAPRDIMRAYRMRANAYIVKPDNVRGFDSTIAGVVSFWLGTASLPR